jgi:hypothetical protein
VVTGAAPDSLLLEELDSPEEPLLEEEPVEVSEPAAGVEVDVGASMPLLDVVPAAVDSPVVLGAVARPAATFLAAACLAAAVRAARALAADAAFAAARFSAAVPEALAVCVAELAAAAPPFAERAGSCPDASCT